MDHIMTMTNRLARWGVGLCALAMGIDPATVPTYAGEQSGVLRVESEIFVAGDEKPLARTLTLFRNGIAWDFLDLPVGKETGLPASITDDCGEIVLHDPARERVVVIDPSRNKKTQIAAIRLERLSASLTSWARQSDDRLVRWAGGPDFGDGFKEQKSQLELIGPRVRYEVQFTPAPFEDAAELYHRFADTAILLKALMHPGGLPPFPRLAINQRVASVGGIPSMVTLDIDAKLTLSAGRPASLRSVHKVHPRLLAIDLERIQQAEARAAVAEMVDLATFIDHTSAVPISGASVQPDSFQASELKKGPKVLLPLPSG